MTIPGDVIDPHVAEVRPRPAVTGTSSDRIRIRGVDLPLDRLVDPRLRDPAWRTTLKQRLSDAQPFPHLVLDDLFHPDLLALVAQEFDDESLWTRVSSAYEFTRRSALGAPLGPASQLYFDIVNSGWFTTCVSSITGVPYLLTDPLLFGGGLHESRVGSHFAVHRDFNKHRHVGLTNEMVVITYLNKGWQPEWGGDLELWDADRKRCMARVRPEFGQTLILPHGPRSFHGHPKPLTPPEGVVRRSVAVYYYSSPYAQQQREDEMASTFMAPRRIDQVKQVARMLTPPLAWKLARKLAQRH